MKQHNAIVSLPVGEEIRQGTNENLKKLLTQKSKKDLYIFNDQDTYVITIGVSGYSIDDFDLKLKENFLIIRASRSKNSKILITKAINWSLKRDFRKVIKIPEYNFKKKIDLSYNGRVLKITFSKVKETSISAKL